MRSRIRYKDESLGEVQLVKDFLPPPEQLVLKEDTVKVTISLSRSSVEFFKNVAKQRHTQYQKMIRHLLDLYVTQFRQRPLTGRSTRRANARR
jgi:predicted DNA binding CopG/RHH family protein